jgi:tRNA(Ile)-lysidine synthase
LLKQFAHKIEEVRRLIDDSRSASFLLAVSGGMDSMCMLDLFSKVLAPSEYAVAHCNFSLRGDESDGDQALVEARSAELGVRMFVKRFDTESYAQEHGISIEMAARELRYSWFEELCLEHGFDVLSVAHNANDNAETLMLNLLRGTGLNGLHGMAEVTGLSAQDSLLVIPKTPAPLGHPLAGGGMSSPSQNRPSLDDRIVTSAIP